MNALRSARSLDTRTWEDALKRATAITKMEDMFEENGRLEWKLPGAFAQWHCFADRLPRQT